jgi:Na+/phosphate symporter
MCLLGLVSAVNVHAQDLTETEPEALFVSFVVGTSMFIVLTLVGTLIVFQRNLNQLRSRLPETPSKESELETDESSASEMLGLIRTADQEVSELDKAIESCLHSLRKPQNSRASRNSEAIENGNEDFAQLTSTIQQQQQQIVQYLELIALQNKKLNSYHRENLKVRSLIQRHSVSLDQINFTPYYKPRQPSSGLRIRPA